MKPVLVLDVTKLKLSELCFLRAEGFDVEQEINRRREDFYNKDFYASVMTRG